MPIAPTCYLEHEPGPPPTPHPMPTAPPVILNTSLDPPPCPEPLPVILNMSLDNGSDPESDMKCRDCSRQEVGWGVGGSQMCYTVADMKCRDCSRQEGEDRY